MGVPGIRIQKPSPGHPNCLPLILHPLPHPCTPVRTHQVLAYGMLCAVTTSGTWQLVAQYYELNVASGQSLIGSIIGFSLVAAGGDSVIWLMPDPKAFPPYTVSEGNGVGG